MTLSLPARVMLAASLTLVLLAFAVVVDLGVSAGRIHPGVAVDGIDLGGMTLTEANEALAQERDRRRARGRYVFSAEGITLVMTLQEGPGGVDWEPQPFDSARKAMAVGRDDAPWGALRDRARAWISGIDVGWAGGVDPDEIEDLIDAWAGHVDDALGVTVDRAVLRRRIVRAARTWPPRVFALPLQKF